MTHLWRFGPQRHHGFWPVPARRNSAAAPADCRPRRQRRDTVAPSHCSVENSRLRFRPFAGGAGPNDTSLAVGTLQADSISLPQRLLPFASLERRPRNNPSRASPGHIPLADRRPSLRRRRGRLAVPTLHTRHPQSRGKNEREAVDRVGPDPSSSADLPRNRRLEHARPRKMFEEDRAAQTCGRSA